MSDDAEVTPAKIKSMLERTYLPLLKCRELLQQARGDLDEAVRLAKEEPRPRWTYLDGDRRSS